MTDVDRIGGVPVVMKALLDAGLLHGDVLTVTGKTMAENLADIAPPDLDGKIIRAMTEPDPPHRRHHDPARLARARGRRREVGRLRRRRLRGHRAGLRRRARRDGRGRGRHAAGRRRRASSATRAPRAARACARCSPSPGRSRAPAWARTSCCSPTAGSPAARPACASATSRPRRSTAARSRSSATATGSGSTSPAGTLDLLVDEAELAARREGWAPPAPKHARGVLAKYAQARRLRRRRRRLRLTHGVASGRRGDGGRRGPEAGSGPRLRGCVRNADSESVWRDAGSGWLTVAKRRAGRLPRGPHPRTSVARRLQRSPRAPLDVPFRAEGFFRLGARRARAARPDHRHERI